MVLCSASCGFDIEHRLVTPFVLACDGEGNTYIPETGEGIETGVRIASVLSAVEKEFETHAAHQHGTDKRRRILVHIHGGLNSRSASLDNAYRSFLRMQSETPEDHCVPIFVTWESGLTSSYLEHLFKIRNGRHQTAFAVATSPIWLATDLVSGIVDTPRTLTTRLVSDVSLGIKVPTGGDLLPSWDYARRNYEAMAKPDSDDPDGAPRFRLGSYSRGGLVQGLRFASYLITLLPSIAVTAIAIDGPGTSAWEAMRHRASNLTHKYGEFKEVRRDGSGEASGPVARLLRELRRHIAERSRGDRSPKYDVVLVGHSMGAMILNDALHELMHEEAEHPDRMPLPVSHIVYMAAACSTQEVVRSVVPYVEKHRDTTEFHALTLHPMADVDERNYYDLAPRGSLLEWLDNWYTKPATPAERRFGKWINLLQTIKLFHTIEKRMTVKGFGVRGSCLPQKHGQFNQCPYWRASFWAPTGPMMYPDDWDDIEGADKSKRF
jgi:pimeloyl-ACP methyl ester carboxylesterase